MKRISLVFLILSIILAFASCMPDNTDEQQGGDNPPPVVDENDDKQEKPEEIKYSEGLEFISNEDGTCVLVGIGSCVDTEINIPPTSPSGDSVVKIEASAFTDADTLVSITIPASVTQIGHYAFKDCKALTTFNFAEDSKLADIGYEVFRGCEALTDIIIPSSVSSIGYYTFKNCKSLDFVSFGENSQLQTIGYELFRGCSSLTSVLIPEGITSIGESAFNGCTSLPGIVIPEGVVSIGNSAFANCDSFAFVQFPSTLTTIGSKAFSRCNSLSKIKVEEGNPLYKDIDGNLYSSDGKTLVLYAMGKKEKTFDIPSGVTTIGKYAFAYGENLYSVNIPGSVTLIDDFAFLGCNSITEVVIPNGVRTIGNSAFYNCTYLASVEISKDVISIGASAFARCTLLDQIVVSGENTRYKDIEGNLYSKDGKELIQYAIGKTDTSFVVPAGVTTIKTYAFHYCENLESVTVSETGKLTTIEYGAFSYCEKLTSVVIPSSVTKIENRTFFESLSLSDVYYTGSESQWSSLGVDDEDINGAAVHFNQSI